MDIAPGRDKYNNCLTFLSTLDHLWQAKKSIKQTDNFEPNLVLLYKILGSLENSKY